MNYRADIDGLRALAVIAVIINHLPGHYFPSGFLGVDVFFVISGFVVTASLIGTDKSHFSAFYSRFLARRIKRLWPALLVCVAITSVAVLSVDPYPNVSIYTGLSSLFGFANVTLFYLQLDYFAQSAQLNAFTHTWSLGVEEQFYILFPIVIWLSFRGSKGDTRRLINALAGIAIISLSLFIFYYSYNQPAAYFLVPMRIWELGAGSLAFLISTRFRETRLAYYLSIGSTFVLTGLLGCFLLPQKYAVFTTILAVLLTSFLLLNQAETLSRRALSFAPVVYVGKISYSLYLYHWPVIVLAPLFFPEAPRIPALYIATMLLASVLSYHAIEHPLRIRSWAMSYSRTIAAGLASSSVICIAIYGALLNIESIRPDRYSNAYPPRYFPLPNSGLSYDTNCIVDGRKKLLTPQTFSLCTTAPSLGSGMPTIWFEGDSHAGHLQSMLYELNEKFGLGVHLISNPGRPFPASKPKKQFGPRQIIHQEILSKARPGDVVAIARRYLHNETLTRVDDMEIWVEKVSALAEQLKKQHLNLVVMGPTPMFTFKDIRRCNLKKAKSCSVDRARLVSQIDSIMDQLASLAGKHENVFIFDSFSTLCPSGPKRCRSHKEGTFMYRDKGHLNVYGATMLTRPFAEWMRASGIGPNEQP
jgi:peptidoglycan/LPS O-acetylase OafA/YrhL/glycerol-3-phosphate cytidylyltransferase-like family protein